MMRLLPILAGMLVAGASPAQHGALPSPGVIADIESGRAALGDIADVGVPVSGSGPRVRVRDVACVAEGDGARCSYTADRCVEAETGADGWCRRRERFVRLTAPRCPAELAGLVQGWAIDSPGLCAPATRHGARLVDGVEALARAPAGSLRIGDFEQAFGVTLARRSGAALGEAYDGSAAPGGLRVTVFLLPDGEIRLSLDGMQGEAIADWRARLAETGWASGARIVHPFVQDAFVRDGRQVRLAHNGATVSSITVFGLNARRD